jgi:hypothetical protein
MQCHQNYRKPCDASVRRPYRFTSKIPFGDFLVKVKLLSGESKGTLPLESKGTLPFDFGVTSTAICGKSITINRDSTGGGWFDQIKTRLQNPDISSTSLLTVNNADLSLSAKTSYQQSVDTQAGLVGNDNWLMTVVAA